MVLANCLQWCCGTCIAHCNGVAVLQHTHTAMVLRCCSTCITHCNGVGFRYTRVSSQIVKLLSGIQSCTCLQTCIIRYSSERHTARNEFEEPRTSIIVPRCSISRINWINPQYPHIMTFYYNRQSFSICLQSKYPGVAVYRLTGGVPRELVTHGNVSGDVGCFKSQCKHITFLFEPLQNHSLTKMKYDYNFNTTSSEA